MSHPHDRRPQGRSPRPSADRFRGRRFDRREGPRSEAGQPGEGPDTWRPRRPLRPGAARREERRPYGPPAEQRSGERPERPFTPRSFERRGERVERGERGERADRGARPQRPAAAERRGAAAAGRSAPFRNRWERPQTRLQGRRWEAPQGLRPPAPAAASADPELAPAADAFAAAAPSDLIWGRHAAQAALESGRPIHRIWCTPEMRFSPRFLQLLREAKASGVLLEEVTWARLGQISGGAVHQGIVLQPAAAETLDLNSLIDGCRALGEPPLLMAVDGLTDPQNLGAIVRSAEALGAHGLVLPQRRNAGLTGSVAKVAAGALEHLPVARVVNLNRSLEALKQEGYRVVGLAAEGNVTLEDADLAGPLVVVTGSEGDGLSMLTRRNCDQLIRIPLRGSTPSLNASVATALLLYEVARRSWMAGLHGTAPAPRIVRPALPSPEPEPDASQAERRPEPSASALPAATVPPAVPPAAEPADGSDAAAADSTAPPAEATEPPAAEPLLVERAAAEEPPAASASVDAEPTRGAAEPSAPPIAPSESLSPSPSEPPSEPPSESPAARFPEPLEASFRFEDDIRL